MSPTWTKSAQPEHQQALIIYTQIRRSMHTSRPTTHIASNSGTRSGTTLSGSLGNSTNDRVRVGFVLHVMQVAGAEVLVTQIINQLSNDIEPTIFCLDSTGELGEKLISQGIPVFVLNRTPGLDLQVAKNLSTEVEKRQIQVLHAHQYTPFFYSALSKIFYGNRSKILFTEHGRHYPDVVSFKRRMANKWFLQRYADLTTACCDFSTQALKLNEGFPNAFTLRNGVDLSNLPARPSEEERTRLKHSLGLDPSLTYAACIARFHKVKDHDTLLHAWKIVQEQLPKSRLLLVGDGELRPHCESLAKQLGIEHSLEFWGIRHDIPTILKCIDVFALTSVSEAASLTLLEAMASECPSVVTDVGGNSEHITHGTEGFLSPRGEFEDIARQLIKVLSDRQLSTKMGQQARVRVIRDFSLTKTIENYSKLLYQLAGR